VLLSFRRACDHQGTVATESSDSVVGELLVVMKQTNFHGVKTDQTTTPEMFWALLGGAMAVVVSNPRTEG
jgi:hypothetical protein